MEMLAKALFCSGFILMFISVVLLLILGCNNTDIMEVSKEIRLFVICAAFMIAGIGIKFLFT